ncbi:MAG: tat pathway signal sequence [Segniliparus sp.]|uniref:tat pathway signal sequence n=1 Tax=Segniliparus sp. TaxID=2804064 RepID=UPI003F2A1270
MAVTHNQRRRTVALVAGLAAVAALSSCSAGWNNQTGSQQAAVDGAPVDSKLVAVRNAYVALAGQEGSLSFVAVNSSIRPLRLTSVSVVYPSGKRQDLAELANKEIPAQGRLQVGPVPAQATADGAADKSRAEFAASPSLNLAGEKLAAGLSVRVEFKVVAPPSQNPSFPNEERNSFHADIPLVGKGESPAKHD